MNVVQSSPLVSRTDSPAVLAASGTTPSVAVIDRLWEPQKLFIHDWTSPVLLSSQWQTVIGKSRTGATQRNGLSDKPLLNLASASKCFNDTQWKNLTEMLSKQQVSRYLAPMHCDPIHGVTLLNPQDIVLGSTSDLKTRRLFVGQYVMIASPSNESMWDEFTCAKVSVINRTSNTFYVDAPLRGIQYNEPTIATAINAITGTGTAPSGGWGYASGSSVVMWSNIDWNDSIGGSSGNQPYTVGGRVNSVSGVGHVVNSKAQAVLIKPNDEIISIAYTVNRGKQDVGVLTPTVLQAVSPDGSPVVQVSPTWTRVALDGYEQPWVESGEFNPTTEFSHQRVGEFVPMSTEVATCRVSVMKTTVTKAQFDTLTDTGTVGMTGSGEAQVYPLASLGFPFQPLGTMNNSNAMMHAVLVVRNGFATPIINRTTAALMTHATTDSPSTVGDGTTYSSPAFPDREQTISLVANAPKSKMIAVQLQTYRNSLYADPVFTNTSDPDLNSEQLYPTSVSPTTQAGNPLPTINNLMRSVTGLSTTDVAVRIVQIRDQQPDSDTPLPRTFRCKSKYGTPQTTPTQPSVTPWLFSVGLLLNPSIASKAYRCYPMIEADASSSLPSYGSPNTSLIGDVVMTATQTSGPPALASADALLDSATFPYGWNTQIYPAFQSNVLAPCNGGLQTSVAAPLLSGVFDYEEGADIRVSSSVNVERVGIGRSIEAYAEKPRKEFDVSATFLSRTKAFAFLQLWNNRKGRLMPVWFANPTNLVSSGVTVAGSVVKFPTTDPVALSTTYCSKSLYVKAASGQVFILVVGAYSYNPTTKQVEATIDATLTGVTSGQTVQTCGLSAAASTAITAGPNRITTAHLCFFDSDELVETWKTDEVMSTSVRLIEHPDFSTTESVYTTQNPPPPPPDDVCGGCCGVVEPCLSLGGVPFGCPTQDPENPDPQYSLPNACCMCFTPDMYLELTYYCYQGCYEVSSITNGPEDCQSCWCLTDRDGDGFHDDCALAGNLCSPSGSVTYQIYPQMPNPLCPPQYDGGLSRRIRFTLPTTGTTPDGSSCANHEFDAFLDVGEGRWTVNSGWLGYGCCAGSACPCIPEGCICLVNPCPVDYCPVTAQDINLCGQFRLHAPPFCNQGCSVSPNCAQIECPGSSCCDSQIMMEGRLKNTYGYLLTNNTNCGVSPWYCKNTCYPNTPPP